MILIRLLIILIVHHSFGEMKVLKGKIVTCFFIITFLIVGFSFTNEQKDTEVDREEIIAASTNLNDEEMVEKLDHTGVSYLMDKNSQYVMKALDSECLTFVYIGKSAAEDGTWDMWVAKENEHEQIHTMENEEGLYTGFPESKLYMDMSYPIEEGKIFGNEMTGRKTITNVNVAMSTAAGHFTNVVEIETDTGWTSYYAPDIGEIKTVDENGKIVSELVEIISD